MKRRSFAAVEAEAVVAGPVAVVVGSLTVGLHGLIDHLEVGVDLALLLIGLDAGFADKLHVLVRQAGDRDALILDHLIGDGHIIVDVTGELLTAAEAGGALKGHLIGLRQAFPGLFVHHDAVDTGGLIPGGGAPVGGDLLQLQGVVGNGLPCTVIGHSERGLERCRKSIEQNWDDLIAEGLATEGNKQAAMALVTITNDPAALQEHTFVFEAVAEGTEEKRAVYETIEQNAAPNVVIASCTSSIDAEILAGLVSHPERLLIAHPFQPVHMLPLVEVVRHEKTAEDTVTRTLALLETLHRQVVMLNRSVPGFLVNRFAQALFRESIYLIEQGVTTAADIDRAVKYAVGMRYASIGLLEYFDAVGYELESAIAKNVYPDLCGTRELQQLVLDGLATGKTGQAAGQGLYDWSQKDADDFRRRKQSPYFAGVKEWAMPDVK